MARKLTNVERRAQRNRTRLKKAAGDRLRLSVNRSSKNISAQIIDDKKGVTVAAASSLEEAVKAKGSNKDGAAAVGKLIAERAIKAGAKSVIFDRGRYLFHGRVKTLADAAREGGLEF
jgi:large subunit ribosomal protein L18